VLFRISLIKHATLFLFTTPYTLYKVFYFNKNYFKKTHFNLAIRHRSDYQYFKVGLIWNQSVQCGFII
jgi:hypothetical protein